MNPFDFWTQMHTHRRLHEEYLWAARTTPFWHPRTKRRLRAIAERHLQAMRGILKEDIHMRNDSTQSEYELIGRLVAEYKDKL